MFGQFTFCVFKKRMPIHKRSINSQFNYTDYKHLQSNYNQSGYNNPTHLENIPTNFVLKTLTLEDCDRGVYEEFNKRFRISNKWMPLIILDAELVSIHYQNYEQFDTDKQYLNGPYFTMFRKQAIPKYRTNPAYKPVMYTVPKMKANGLVYEDYIAEGPLSWELVYDLKFISNFREYTNEMEAQMRHYFRNKRNIIVVDTQRFSIGPTNQDALAQVEIINRESVEQKTMYVSTYELKLYCWTFDASNVQKRERPNTYVLDISVKDSLTQKKDAPYILERFSFNTNKYPRHPSPDQTNNPHILRQNVENWLTEDGFNITDEGGGNINNQGNINLDLFSTDISGQNVTDGSGQNITDEGGSSIGTQ